MSTPRRVTTYPSGAKLAEFPVDDADQPHGLATGYFESGARQWECEVHHGERHGTLRFWYETGTLQSTREYLHGMRHGAFTDWHRNGVRAAEGEYRGDELVAVQEWDDDGRDLPGALERWQAQIADAQAQSAAAEAAAAPPTAHDSASHDANEADDANVGSPEWIQRQAELGELFLVLWLSPWANKRKLVEEVPDLADPTRQMFARMVIQRAVANKPDGGPEIDAIIAAHQPLIERCASALRTAAATGGALGPALDEVFDDHELWLDFHARTGQPQE